jgi:hypothetical protein
MSKWSKDWSGPNVFYQTRTETSGPTLHPAHCLAFKITCVDYRSSEGGDEGEGKKKKKEKYV